MSINLDYALISAIIESGQMAEALSLGADKKGILSPEAKVYWNSLQEHFDKFNQTPSVELFQTGNPSYEHKPTGDSVESLLHQLKTRKLKQEMQEWVYTIVDDINENPWKAKKTMFEAAEYVAQNSDEDNQVYIAGENADYYINKLENIAKNDGLSGLAFPWEAFNKVSRGLEAGHCIYIYGRQKSKKTFLLLYLALHYWRLGLKILLFTREMSHEELMWRMISLGTKLPINDVMKGNLTSNGKKKVAKFLAELKESERFIISSDTNGINGFRTQIDRIRPDMVFHDYFKAMADDAMGNASRDPRIFVERVVDQIVDFMSAKARKKVPCFFVGHANRTGDGSKGRSGTEQAWSDHITRRVDAAIRVISDESKTALIVNRSRFLQEGMGITVDGTLCTPFGNLVSEGYDWIDSKQEDNKKDFRKTASNRMSGGIDLTQFRRT